MTCIYENNCDGLCSLSADDEGEFDPDQAQQGCDEEGYCGVGDDPDPSDSCDAYESSYVCIDCDADLWVSECECEEE